MGSFLRDVIGWLIEAVIICLVINAVLSWLIAFDVVNVRNQAMRQLVRFLDAVTRPILRPVQRIIPPLGGVDITPIIVIVVLSFFKIDILPLIFNPLVAALG